MTDDKQTKIETLEHAPAATEATCETIRDASELIVFVGTTLFVLVLLFVILMLLLLLL